MKSFSLIKVKENDLDTFEEIYFREGSSCIITSPTANVSNDDIIQFFYHEAFIVNPTQEDLDKFQKECEKMTKEFLKYDYKHGGCFFIKCDNIMVGYVVVQKNGKNSNLTLRIKDLGFQDSFVPTINDIENIVKEVSKQFKNVGKIEMYSICNSRFVETIKKIGFIETSIGSFEKIIEEV